MSNPYNIESKNTVNIGQNSSAKKNHRYISPLYGINSSFTKNIYFSNFNQHNLNRDPNPANYVDNSNESLRHLQVEVDNKIDEKIPKIFREQDSNSQNVSTAQISITPTMQQDKQHKSNYNLDFIQNDTQQTKQMDKVSKKKNEEDLDIIMEKPQIEDDENEDIQQTLGIKRNMRNLDPNTGNKLLKKQQEESYKNSINLHKGKRKTQRIAHSLEMNKVKQANDSQVGSEKLEALIESFKKMDDSVQPSVIDVKGNNLKHSVVLSLLNTLRKHLTHLNLQSCSVELEGFMILSELFRKRLSLIKQLNIESCKMSDKGGVVVVKHIKFLRQLNQLNMNSNDLGNQTGTELGLVFANFNIRVESLYLNQNRFNGHNLKEFLESMQSNDVMKNLDLSWNQLGIDNESVLNLAECLSRNTGIVHVDLSHNDIKQRDSLHLTNLLRLNHNLMGVHCVGNHFQMDMDVQVQPRSMESEEAQFSRSFYKDQMIKGAFANLESSIQKLSNPEYATQTKESLNRCWVCEKWVPFHIDIEFNEVPDDEFDDEMKVFVHQEFNDQLPRMMYSDYTGTKLQMDFMAPIGNWTFFFSYGLEKDRMKVFIDPVLKKQKQEKHLNVILIQDFMNMEKTKRKIQVNEFNTIKVEYQGEPINFQKSVPINPRSMDGFVYTADKVKWKLSTSIFASRLNINNAKKFLFAYSNDMLLIERRLPKEIGFNKEFEQEIKHVFEKNYKQILMYQKQQSSFGRVDRHWCINNADIALTIIEELKLQDHQFNSLSAMNMFFDCYNEKDFQTYGNYCPEHAIVRHQFLLAIFRLIMKISRPSDGMVKIYTDFFKKFTDKMASQDPEVWRYEKFYNEDVEKQWFKCQNIIMNLYKRSSSIFYPNLYLDQLEDTIVKMELYKQLPKDKLGVYFMMSIAQVSDETGNSEQFRIKSKHEFFECWARLVDELKIDIKQILWLKPEYKNVRYEDLDLSSKLWVVTFQILQLYPNNSDHKQVEEIKWIMKKHSPIHDIKDNINLDEIQTQ